MNQANSPIYQKFRPQTKQDFQKVQELEQALVKYVLLRFVEEADVETVVKLNEAEFQNLTQLANILKETTPNFQQQYYTYVQEFLEKYV